ncbi:amidohydrolase family protein [Shumkonia mesophila]|uniref:amidohydrolase family protein n=1 Tax=Shumkonia mesophila TaxID=2838854 RepID=UPI002934EA4A|nr:amidohydrolase family protein [Shumkonia mesophila]
MVAQVSRHLMAVAAALWLAAAPVGADEPPIGAAIEGVPVFDAHMHYKQDAWGPYPVKTVIELMDKSGVAMALVSSTPDDGTIRLWEYAPERIVPELRPYHGAAGSSNWTQAQGMEAYLADRLARYPHQGIGEFHIHRLDMEDRPLLVVVAALAKARGVPLHIHSGAEPVRFFFGLEPALTIVWAHAGMSEPAEAVGQMLDTYATLYADTSFRERDILGDGSQLNPAWKAVIERHADRLMVGTDTWINAQWDDYEGLIALNRRWLALLPRETAEKIAYRNAARLFGREIPPRRPGAE